MTAFHQPSDRVPSVQHKLGLIGCAVLALALLGSIVHDLGASPSRGARTGSVARAMA